MISTVPLAQMAAGFEKHRTGKVRRAVSVQTSRLRQPQRQTSGRRETSPYSALLGLGCCMKRRGALKHHHDYSYKHLFQACGDCSGDEGTADFHLTITNSQGKSL